MRKSVPMRVMASMLAMTFAIGTSTILCMTPSMAYADAVSDARQAFDEAVTAYDEACDEAERAKQAADEAQKALDDGRRTAQDAIRETYKHGNTTYACAVASIITSDIGQGIRNMEACSSISEWSDESVNGLVLARDEAEQAKSDAETKREAAESARTEAERQYQKACEEEKDKEKNVNAQATVANASDVIIDESSVSDVDNGFLTVAQMVSRGVVYYNGWQFTYYSQRVLPGNGLRIPGRHVENGKVCDKDGYVCVASSVLEKGTVVRTPIGLGRVYDAGCARNTLDVFLDV